MNKFFTFFLALALLVSFAWADAPLVQSTEKEDYVAGQIIAYVPNTRDVDVSQATNLLESWGYTATRENLSIGGMDLVLFQANDRSAAKNVEEAVKLFNNELTRGEVKLLPNYIFKVLNEIKEPCFNRPDVYKDRDGNPHNILLQWDMNNPGELGGIAGADLNVVEAWKMLPASSKPIVVAVIDTGVDTEHPGLKGRIAMKNGEVHGKDFTSWFGGGSHLDDHGHGSHCAGSIAAAYNDGEGMTGSAGPTNVKIIPIKALAKSGAGDLISIASAMKWAGEQKADIISMSLGATPLWPEQEPILKQVFDEIVAAPELSGTILIAAAGNNGQDIHAFPAFCDKVIAIGASDHQDKIAVFSNFGNWVDVVSPGVNIVSVRGKHDGKYLDMYQDAGHKKAEYAIGNKSKAPYDSRKYFIASGTSMATPNAAGVAAMLLSANPNLKANTDALRKILMETSDKKGSFKIKADGGRINAKKALEAALNLK